MAFRFKVVSSSLYPPERNIMAGTAAGAVLWCALTVFSATTLGASLGESDPGVTMFGFNRVPSSMTRHSDSELPPPVLIPDHYDKCLAVLPHVSSAGINLCFWQYKKNRFKSYDPTSLSGYFDQPVFSCLSICTLSGDEGVGNEGSATDPSYKGNQLAKGPQSFATDSLTFKLGNENHFMSARLPCDDIRYSLPVKRPMSLKFVGTRQWLTPP